MPLSFDQHLHVGRPHSARSSAIQLGQSGLEAMPRWFLHREPTVLTQVADLIDRSGSVCRWGRISHLPNDNSFAVGRIHRDRRTVWPLDRD